MERTADDIHFFEVDRNFRSFEIIQGAYLFKHRQILIGLTGLNPYRSKQPEIEWQFGVPDWGRGPCRN